MYSSVLSITNSRVWNFKSSFPAWGAKTAVRLPVHIDCNVLVSISSQDFHDKTTYLSTIGVPEGVPSPLALYPLLSRLCAFTCTFDLQLHILQTTVEPCHVEAWQRCSMDLELLCSRLAICRALRRPHMLYELPVGSKVFIDRVLPSFERVVVLRRVL